MFNPTWNSLRGYQTPQWLRDAKFGIYTHWGIYSVPAYGPNGSWYPHMMYKKGSDQNLHHIKTYGDPSVFGYKDFIGEFTGEKFDAEEWAALFKAAGAGFAGPVAEHHDGFAMWDTAYSEWNAVNMGPKRNVVAELEQAIRRQGMKFMVALHHMEHWNFFPHEEKSYDAADPAYEALYGIDHNRAREVRAAEPEADWMKPDQSTLDMWLGKTKELIDGYSPDAIWFDFGLQFVQEHYKREMLAYYYEQARKEGKEVALMYKFNDMVAGTGLIDLELGRFDTLMRHEWITDTTVDDGEGWSYIRGAKYKSPRTLIQYLIDNVSKNGYLLLNIGPTPTGEIPEEAKHILAEMGKWLAINGEAIYATTPWLLHGEGPTHMQQSGNFTEGEVLQYTPQDFRYTAKDDVIYATCLAWASDEFVMEKLHALYAQEIAGITMLGDDKPLDWKMTDKALVVASPKEKPCDHAYVLKIERKRPY